MNAFYSKWTKKINENKIHMLKQICIFSYLFAVITKSRQSRSNGRRDIRWSSVEFQSSTKQCGSPAEGVQQLHTMCSRYIWFAILSFIDWFPPCWLTLFICIYICSGPNSIQIVDGCHSRCLRNTMDRCWGIEFASVEHRSSLAGLCT